METAGVQFYSVRYTSYDFNFRRRQAGVQDGSQVQSVGSADFLVSYMDFRLDVQYKAEPQFQNQAGIRQFFENKDFDFSKLEHDGKPILELSPAEAGELVASDGFWGVAQTSDRLAGFVINGAGDNLEKLQAGREGIIRGFNEAEKIWGGTLLPDISYKTREQALGRIDDRIRQLGGAVVDITA